MSRALCSNLDIRLETITRVVRNAIPTLGKSVTAMVRKNILFLRLKLFNFSAIIVLSFFISSASSSPKTGENNFVLFDLVYMLRKPGFRFLNDGIRFTTIPTSGARNARGRYALQTKKASSQCLPSHAEALKFPVMINVRFPDPGKWCKSSAN
jgi:hypothetical protein